MHSGKQAQKVFILVGAIFLLQTAVSVLFPPTCSSCIGSDQMIKLNVATCRCTSVRQEEPPATTGILPSSQDWIPPTMRNTSLILPKTRPLLPVQVFEEWKAQHSAEVLRHESVDTLKNRKYIAAYFSCPHQAGVQAGIYSNALLLAIATNRTLLFRYDGMRQWIKNGENAPEICSRIFKRASWIPLYEDYADVLSPIRVMERLVFRGRSGMNAHEIRDRIDNGESFEDLGEEQVVEAVKLWGLGAPPGNWMGLMDLMEPYARSYFGHIFKVDFAADPRIQDLYNEGVLFLYGMLFFESFVFTPEFVETVKFPGNDEDQEHSFSVALHSRHTHGEDIGDDTQREKVCLDRILTDENLKGKTCTLYLMSDRTETLQQVAFYATRMKHCRVIMSSDHKTSKNQDVLEHGPFAGTGYFQDLLLVSRAQMAFAGKRRSSSALVAEFIEYRRRIQAWRKDGTRNLPRLLQCNL